MSNVPAWLQIAIAVVFGLVLIGFVRSGWRRGGGTRIEVAELTPDEARSFVARIRRARPLRVGSWIALGMCVAYLVLTIVPASGDHPAWLTLTPIMVIAYFTVLLQVEHSQLPALRARAESREGNDA